MKQYKDYKTQFKFILILALILVPGFFSYGQTAEEISSKIEERNQAISNLEKDIKAYQAELLELSKQKNSLSTSIKQLDLTKKKLNADISISENKIQRTNLKINELGSEIVNKGSAISTAQDVIANSIRAMNSSDLTSMSERLLSEKNFSEVWVDIDTLVSLRERLKGQIVELKEVKGELEDTRTETIKAKEELVALKSQLADQKKVVDQNTAEKNKLLAQTKNGEANYQKLLQQQVAKKAAFEKELRDYESQLKFILDPAKLPSAGILSWPLDEIFVTQEFGAKTGPHRTYASGHSGTDFRARTPLPVKAMANGTVKGVGDTDASCPGASFGRWVFIEYDNGLSSTYGHLSIMKVTEGQRVSRGEVVAYSGGTGRVTGPHLHVTLYVSNAVSVQTIPSVACPGRILKQPIAAINAYLDPMFYLPPYNI